MGRRKYKGPIIGPFFFNIYKPVGMTSFQVVNYFKKRLPPAIGKIGHFGTLDPFAEGVLLIGIGQSTRLNQYTQNLPKEYIATGVLGSSSPTGDIDTDLEFTIDESFESEKFQTQEIDQALQQFLGEYLQVPHVYSATKHQGKALHEWAREGVEIKKDPVSREIYEIELLERVDSLVTFRVVVSSGTYIRVLFEDVAKKMGTLGHLKSLKRSKIGHHELKSSILREDWPEGHDQVEEFLKSVGRSVTELVKFDKVDLNSSESLRFQNGMTIKKELKDGHYWVLSDDKLYGLGEVKDNNLKTSIGISPAASLKIDYNYVK